MYVQYRQFSQHRSLALNKIHQFYERNQELFFFFSRDKKRLTELEGLAYAEGLKPHHPAEWMLVSFAALSRTISSTPRVAAELP